MTVRDTILGAPEWGERASRLVEWHDPHLTASAGQSMSGLEFLGALMRGELAPAPIAQLMRFRPIELEVGRVVFAADPDESVYNPIGVVHGGYVATLADTVAACAVHSTLDAGQGYTSIDLNLRYLRPVTHESGTLIATGTILKPGRRVAVAEAEIVDGAGKLVASATSSCLVIPREGP
jgi:uncharacterized protein (TIGR00369 family)